jgi:protoheme IX farnesyltransferase
MLLGAGRWRLALATALATLCGALIPAPAWEGRTTAVFLGALLFALGCTWWNQLQERHRDVLMDRTRTRPLPGCRIPVRTAILFTGFCFAVSLPLLFACGGLTAVAILVSVLLFYNGLYTPFKEKTLLALFPGAVAGAMPPVLGWVCGGGKPWDPGAISLWLLFLLWQVPHFWLAAERRAPEYERAGLPLPWSRFGRGRYGRLLALWMSAFCVLLLAFPAFGFVHALFSRVAMVIFAACLMGALCVPAFRPGALFHLVNVNMAAVCVLLVADKMYWG